MFGLTQLQTSPRKAYEDIVDAMRQQFHSTADQWLLRQKLNNRKQLPSETVTTYAADIRRISRRIDLPRTEAVNYFIQGLKPALKSYVMLQQPSTIEEAENHAKLKESAPDPTIDKMDQVINLLTKKSEPATIAAYKPIPSHPQRDSSESQTLKREDIVQIIRQELQRTNNKPTLPNQNRTTQSIGRNRRTFDGRPICNYCQKIGHISTVCRQRLGQNSGDPRIPYTRPNYQRNSGPPTFHQGNGYSKNE